MSQHTPGPWTVRKGAIVQVVASVGPVAQVYNRDDNARLIAAAPEMKDVLSGLLLLAKHEVWCVRFTQGDEDCTCFVSKAHALLARIAGE